MPWPALRQDRRGWGRLGDGRKEERRGNDTWSRQECPDQHCKGADDVNAPSVRDVDKDEMKDLSCDSASTTFDWRMRVPPDARGTGQGHHLPSHCPIAAVDDIGGSLQMALQRDSWWCQS
eukprot:447071-Rhodomonas_salina.2